MTAVATTTTPGYSQPGIPLSQLVPGQRARLCPECLEAGDGRYLRALGLRPHATVRLCRRGEPCIVDVMTRGGCGCRIGLARPIAEALLVNPLA
jgi:hypothetical protein